MICPKCKSTQVIVCDSRPSGDGTRRRRKCLDCDYRYSTVEIAIGELERLNAKEAFLAEVLRKAENLSI